MTIGLLPQTANSPGMSSGETRAPSAKPGLAQYSAAGALGNPIFWGGPRASTLEAALWGLL
jgi:hypothetical protein